MNARFIDNIGENHLDEIISLIAWADEIWMATAFLKSSGIKKLLPYIEKHLASGKQINIIAGQHFALTEPEALRSLYNLSLIYNDLIAHLAHALKVNSVFHPKLYVFRRGAQFKVISGSANITEGGLLSNIECSLCSELQQGEKAVEDIQIFMQKLFSQSHSQRIKLSVIKQYESFFLVQKQNNRKIKAIPDKSEKRINFLSTLRTHFTKFDNAGRNEMFKNKMRDYAEAKKILNEIADHPHLTQSAFIPLLDQLVGNAEEWNLWHSGSMDRLRKYVFPHYKEFKELVKYIRSNASNDAASVFQAAKQKVNKIEGAGINYITEIMMTYNHKDFANMNRNPLYVLRTKGGLNLKASAISYNGEDYEEYCEVIKEISVEFGIRNMLEADSFFNQIYWKN